MYLAETPYVGVGFLVHQRGTGSLGEVCGADGNFPPFSAEAGTWANRRLPGKNFPSIGPLFRCLAAGRGYRSRRLVHTHTKGGGGRCPVGREPRQRHNAISCVTRCGCYT